MLLHIEQLKEWSKINIFELSTFITFITFGFAMLIVLAEKILGLFLSERNILMKWLDRVSYFLFRISFFALGIVLICLGVDLLTDSDFLWGALAILFGLIMVIFSLLAAWSDLSKKNEKAKIQS